MARSHQETIKGGGVSLTNPLAERAVLEAILANPARAWNHICTLGVEPEWFTDRVCLAGFTAISKLMSAGKPVDMVLISEEICKGNNGFALSEEFKAAFSNPVPANAVSGLAAHLALVKDKYHRRSVSFYLEDAKERLHRDDAPVEGVIATMKRCIGDTLADSTKRQETHEELAERILAGFDFAKDGAGADVEWPWMGLRLISKGAKRGKVTLVAARPGEGKTTVANQLAAFTAINRKEPTGFWSLEMTRRELVENIVGARVGLEVRKMNEGKFNHEEREIFRQGLESIKDAPLYIDDNTYGIDHLCAVIRESVFEKSLSLVVIDYLGMIQSDGRFPGKRNEEVGMWSNSLTNLAKECPDTAFVILHQLNRGNVQEGNRRPELHNLRDSGSLEQDAYAVLFIYQDPNVEGSVVDNAPTILEFAKNRGGPKGCCSVTFAKSKQRIEG